jgi:uncharacterized zinc-type alcohol dehydrogenase-like protein
MSHARGYAVQSATSALAPFTFDRQEVGDRDIRIQIAYCGVCHSDIHQARNEWGGSIYPMVPGHEIVGHVTEVGRAVTKCKVGDLAGVGCMVDSCRQCGNCHDGEEQYCTGGLVLTYNGRYHDGRPTFGGYSNFIVVDEAYSLMISPSLHLAAVAPLLCAGITTYSPLKHWKVGPGHQVGVVGLGGLGHMAVKLASSLGAHVTQFTSSPGKVEDAKRLGAGEVIVTRDPKAIADAANRFDFVIDTVSGVHDVSAYLTTLRRNGSMVMVGLPEKPLAVPVFSLALGRRSLAGSAIGGIRETQEMLDYCAAHHIVADIELISMDEVNAAYDRMLAHDVKYRFVIDMATLR